MGCGDLIHEQFGTVRRLIVENRETATLWLTGCKREEMDEIDRYRFEKLAEDYFKAHSQALMRRELHADLTDNMIESPSPSAGAKVPASRRLYQMAKPSPSQRRIFTRSRRRFCVAQRT